jgi:hypothetical protein
MNKCYKPTAAGPEGVALCILEEGHEGSCDGGELERRIGEHFAADRLAKEWDYAGLHSWDDVSNKHLGLDI